MNKVRVTKEFNFEIAHALWNYDGPCENLHGHSYKLFVTVIGTPINDEANSKNGMVIDFGDLKQIVNEEIVDNLDHAVILNSNAARNIPPEMKPMFERRLVVDYQPTCENLVLDFAKRIKGRLPKELRLFSLKLHETGSSFAEWYASDNE